MGHTYSNYSDNYGDGNDAADILADFQHCSRALWCGRFYKGHAGGQLHDNVHHILYSVNLCDRQFGFRTSLVIGALLTGVFGLTRVLVTALRW